MPCAYSMRGVHRLAPQSSFAKLRNVRVYNVASRRRSSTWTNEFRGVPKALLHHLLNRSSFEKLFDTAINKTSELFAMILLQLVLHFIPLDCHIEDFLRGMPFWTRSCSSFSETLPRVFHRATRVESMPLPYVANLNHTPLLTKKRVPCRPSLCTHRDLFTSP